MVENALNNNLVINEAERLLSAKFNVEVKINGNTPVGGGSISNALVIDTDAGQFFMKWNDNCYADLFIREAEGLTELKKTTDQGLLIPEVIVTKEAGTTPGFLIQEYLQPGYCDNADEKLGRGLALIHSYKNNRFGFFNDNYCGATKQNNSWRNSWPEFFRDNRLGFLLGLIEKERPLPVSEMKVYDKLLDKINRLIPESSDAVLIHGDLWSGNYLHTLKGPALIDPAVYYANREMEFGMITLFGGFSSAFFYAYNEINHLSDDWKQRNKLYQLYHILNHYYLFGGGYRLQALNVAKSYL